MMAGMDITEALTAAQKIIDLDIPTSTRTRNKLVGDDGALATAVADIEEFLADLTEKVEGLRELTYELAEAARGDLHDYMVNVQGAAEEVRDQLAS